MKDIREFMAKERRLLAADPWGSSPAAMLARLEEWAEAETPPIHAITLGYPPRVLCTKAEPDGTVVVTAKDGDVTCTACFPELVKAER